MSSLENLKTRLSFQGGQNQENRMINNKLKSLKKALLYSYQAATAILADKREFRCLMNPDKNSLDYEDKIVSIPFRDIRLNKEKDGKTLEGEEEIGLKVGDVFIWKETNTKWLVYLQMIEEEAYFRAQVRKCNCEVLINDTIYDAYIKGPDENTLLWHTRRELGSWSDLNYTAEMYITKNEETEAFFHRFAKIRVKDRPWEVAAVDNISSDGVITLFLQETFKNTIKDQAEAEEAEKTSSEEQDTTLPHISGDAIVYPYDVKRYVIMNESDGEWYLENNNNKAIIFQQDSESAIVEFVTGRSGNVDLVYKKEGIEDVILPITIKPL